MHRHGYIGRKFHRKTDQRRSLEKSLIESVIIHESITTTLPKAKEIRPKLEKLITTAKQNSLASRRRVISRLHTKSSAHKLVDEIVPKLKSRNSGYLRIKKLGLRRGDNTQLASISFIFDQKDQNNDQPAKDITTPSKLSEKTKPKQTEDDLSLPKNTKQIDKKASNSKKKETKKWKLSRQNQHK